MEHVVQDQRDKELQAEFESRKTQPRIRMMARILIQASMIYTPPIFEVFQAEYEKAWLPTQVQMQVINLSLQLELLEGH